MAIFHSQRHRQLTHLVPTGLARLEYRGYDSAGLAVDGDKRNEVFAFKEVGKVAKLKELIEQEKPDLTKVFDAHVGIAHTRWATHGPPSRVNCHPHRYEITKLRSLVFQPQAQLPLNLLTYGHSLADTRLPQIRPQMGVLHCPQRYHHQLQGTEDSARGQGLQIRDRDRHRGHCQARQVHLR